MNACGFKLVGKFDRPHSQKNSPKKTSKKNHYPESAPCGDRLFRRSIVLRWLLIPGVAKDFSHKFSWHPPDNESDRAFVKRVRKTLLSMFLAKHFGLCATGFMRG